MRRRRRLVARLLMVAAVLGVLAVGAAWLYRALPRMAAAEIGRLLNARVEMRAVDLGRDGSVSVAGLVLRPREPQTRYDNTILRAEHVCAKFSRRSLLRLSPRVTDIRVEDFLLDVQLNLNTGRWNIGNLRFNAGRTGEGGGLPTLSLQGGKLRYCRISGARQEVVLSVAVEARFGREFETDPTYHFEIKAPKLAGGYGESRLSGRWRPCSVLPGPGYALTQAAQLSLAGSLSPMDIPSLEEAWAVDVLAAELNYDRVGDYSLKLNMNGLHGRHAPQVAALRCFAPAAQGSGWLQTLQEFFDQYQPTGTVGAITLEARGNVRRLDDSEIEGKVVCKDISVRDRDFPYRLDHLCGDLEFTQSTMRPHRLVGRHGPVEVCIDGWTRGFGADRQYQYQITSPNLILDRDLYTALDAEQKRFWDAFHPTGTIAADYRLTRTSPTDKRWTLSVDLNDVTAAFREFPYPLVGLTGNLFFDRQGILLSDVVAGTGGRQIRINGKVTEPPADPTCYISIEAVNLPLDAALRDALPVQHRELFNRFDLSGRAEIRARVFSVPPPGTQDPGAVPASRPRAEQGDRTVALAGPKSSGPVAPAEADGSRRVSFLADVSCRECSVRLPSCFSASAGQTASSGTPPSQGRGRADAQPLVLSKITAEATVTPDSLSLKRFDGRYEASPVAMAGGLRFGGDDKLCECSLKISAQKVPLDEATIGVLPPALAPQVAAFHPAGDVDLVMHLRKADGNEPPEYTVVINCLGDRIKHERFPYPLHDVRGTLSFAQDELIFKDVTARPQAGRPATEEEEARSEEGARAGTGQTQSVAALERLDFSPSAKSFLSPTAGSGSLPSAVIRLNGSATLGRGVQGVGPVPARGSFTLQAKDMRFTQDLGRALPQTLGGLYRELAPRGPFDLDLTTLKVSRATGDETLVEFDGKMTLGSRSPAAKAAGSAQPCELKVFGGAAELTGVLQAQGAYSARRGFERGRARLAADRLVVSGKAVTGMNFDAVCDPNMQTWTARNFVGACYGGKLLGSLEIGPAVPAAEERRVASGDRPVSAGLEYQLQVALQDVDLQQFLSAGKAAGPAQAGQGTGSEVQDEARATEASTASSGTMDAWLSLHARMGAAGAAEPDLAGVGSGGLLRGPTAPQPPALEGTRHGICRVEITNMQVHKVSALGNILSVLRLGGPTDYTFERMALDSYLKGDKLLIPRLDLSGRNAALAGAGTMDLPTEELNLTLTARGQRVAAAEPSVLQSLTEGLGGAVVRVEVTGRAGSPRVQKKALPVLEDSLRILGTLPEEGKKVRK